MKSYIIHLVRHGMTEGNKTGQYVGSMDVDITTEGINQLKELKKKYNYGNPQVIYRSPLKRCKQTTDILFDGADTVVVCDHQILGKPKDAQDARRILHMLGGRTHQVYTGVCFVGNEAGTLKHHTFYEKTDVTMYDITDAQIDWYISTNEPFDKAGAYGIQDNDRFPIIDSIDGEKENVIGLPIKELKADLIKLGIIND